MKIASWNVNSLNVRLPHLQRWLDEAKPDVVALQETKLDISDVGDRMRALRVTGVPYSANEEEYQRNVKQFGEAVARTLHIPDARKNLVAQAQDGNFDGDRASVSEMDALVAYLQVLGTMVDFSKIKPEELVKFR